MTILTKDSSIPSALDSVMSMHIGRANAIKFDDLMRMVKALVYPETCGKRHLRKVLEHERPGICFCTSRPGGYFLPVDDAEVNATVDSLDAYIRGLAARRKSILRAYPNAAQMRLEI
jgi:hypothetical protein